LVPVGPGPDPARSGDTDAQRQAPHILTRNIVKPEEAEKLFEMYVAIGEVWLL
jgi:hypothetical protein